MSLLAPLDTTFDFVSSAVESTIADDDDDNGRHSTGGAMVDEK
jgi:hypothetical protein